MDIESPAISKGYPVPKDIDINKIIVQNITGAVTGNFLNNDNNNTFSVNIEMENINNINNNINGGDNNNDNSISSNILPRPIQIPVQTSRRENRTIEISDRQSFESVLNDENSLAVDFALRMHFMPMLLWIEMFILFISMILGTVEFYMLGLGVIFTGIGILSITTLKRYLFLIYFLWSLIWYIYRDYSRWTILEYSGIGYIIIQLYLIYFKFSFLILLGSPSAEELRERRSRIRSQRSQRI